MTTWDQIYGNFQFTCLKDGSSSGSGGGRYDLEILNNTSLTFARPESEPYSHTAAKTRHLKKQREDLPSLRIDTNVMSPSLRSKSSNNNNNNNNNNHHRHYHYYHSHSRQQPSSQQLQSPPPPPPLQQQQQQQSPPPFGNYYFQQQQQQEDDDPEQLPVLTITEPPNNYNDGNNVTRSPNTVKFNLDQNHLYKPEEENNNTNTNNKNNGEYDRENDRLQIKKRTLRRASAPSHGMPFYYSAPEKTSIHFFGQSSQDINLTQTNLDNNKDDDNLNNNNIINNINDDGEDDNKIILNNNIVNKLINKNRNQHRISVVPIVPSLYIIDDIEKDEKDEPSIASSSNSSCNNNNVPSLSPCSSTSSLSSSVEIHSPAQSSNINNHHHYQQQQQKDYQQHQQQPSQQKNNHQRQSSVVIGSFMPLKPKSHSVSSYKPEAFSLPNIPNMVTSSSYDEIPWSPAKDFLANIAQSTAVKQLSPDEEGQQVGEYIIGKVIGRGGFSTVKEAIRMDDHSEFQKIAVKIVKNNKESENNDRIQALLEREIKIWKNLNHPNIVQMISTEENDYATYVFSEYCSGGNLLQYIKKKGGECRGGSGGRGLDEDEARKIFSDISEGLRYLHNDMRLVHKDLKLDNIILDKENTWKICDFGLTEFQNDFDGDFFVNGNNNNNINDDNHIAGGSLAYCPPEQVRSKIPLKEPSVDIWSLGVVLYAMVTGQLPFMDDFMPRLQYKIINGRYDEAPLNDAGVSNQLKSLLKGMFKTKPNERLNINQILEHEWCLP